MSTRGKIERTFMKTVLEEKAVLELLWSLHLLGREIFLSSLTHLDTVST